ncbi:predicted protein [Sparassis crispa]|uniref:Uncharacterized protein n=1 Tax=Sparassis crispa TaxID=139825 RepID=A0A401H0Q0_9APHY|nr:predicted protein [Sparassis crispa]GBE87983.1 predicted protein [Sparassis crispa]
MFATLITVALFSTLTIQGAQAQGLSIDTPTIAQCQAVTVTWTSTNNPPYNLVVVNSDDPCGDAIDDLGDYNGLATNWTVNVPAGMSVTFSLMDSQGDEAWSGDMVVGQSDDASCLSANSSVSSASSGSSSASVDSSAIPAAAEAKTTLYVSPSFAEPTASSHSASASSSAAVPVGAANAGTNPTNSAGYSMREYSAPIMVLSAIAAIALSL